MTTKIQQIRANMEADKATAKAALGDGVICSRCGATIHTMNDLCVWGANDWCQGENAYEAALEAAASVRKRIGLSRG